MGTAKRDDNYVPTLIAVSNADGSTPVTLYADPVTHRLLVSATSGSLNDLSDVVITTGAQGDILYNNGTNWVNLAPGTSGKFLKTQGAGANPMWDTATAAAGGGDTQVQFNDGGTALGGDAGMTYNKTTDTLTLAGNLQCEDLLIEDSNASHYLTITTSSDLTAARTLTLVPGDADRSITLAGNLNIAGNLSTSGGHALTLTTSGDTNVTLPTTGTLVSTGSKLSVFAATSSAELAGVISDETGSGALVFGTAPVFPTKITVGSASGTTGSIEVLGTTSGTVTLKVADEAGTYTLTLPTTDGDANQFLQTNGSGVLTWASGGTGDVTSSGNITDNVLIKGDGGAKGIQETGITIADTTNNVSGMGTLGCGEITIANGGGLNLQEDINFTGATTENLILFPDNLANALTIGEGANAYITFVSTDGSESVSVAKTLALGSNNVTMSGSIGVTGTRVTKLWATDIESTNMPTVGGTAILSSLTAPQFTTIELGHADDTTLSRPGAGRLQIEGKEVATLDNTMTFTNKTLGAGTTTMASNALIDVTVPTSDGHITGPMTDSINSGYSAAAFDLVFLGSGGKWLEVDSDTVTTCKGMLGIALEAKNDTEAMKVALPGSFIRNDTWNWTVGATLYAGETLGAMQEAIPTGADAIIRVVGFAVTADCIFFMPSSDQQSTVA
jgi:hypothetical protein